MSNNVETSVSEAQGMIKRWMESETMTLGNHFHGKVEKVLGTLDPEWRVSEMGLDGSRIFKACEDKTIESFHISFSLQQEHSQGLNIVPLLCINYVGDEKAYLKMETPEPELEPVKNGEFSESNPGSAQVPVQFLNVVTQNWRLLDPAQIDNVFLAYQQEAGNSRTSRLKRLLGYHLSETVNQGLFRKLCGQIKNKSLSALNFHFGVDLNKSVIRTEFSFTPVIEVKTSGSIKEQLDAHAIDLSGVNFQNYGDMPVFVPPLGSGSGDDDTSWYFEYLFPCPSTCN